MKAVWTEGMWVKEGRDQKKSEHDVHKQDFSGFQILKLLKCSDVICEKNYQLNYSKGPCLL